VVLQLSVAAREAVRVRDGRLRHGVSEHLRKELHLMAKIGPAAGASSGRSGPGSGVATSLAEINVVPLVDVMLVLLIIFMVTAPLLQRGIDVNLPTAVRASAIQGERIFINVPAAFHQDRIVYLADEPIRLAILRERIRQKVENQTDK